MRVREYGVLVALALIWGASFLFIKIGVEDVSPATLVFGRLAFSVLTLGAIIAVKPALAKGWRDYWRLGLLVGLINIVLPYLLIAWGETRIASGIASILNATTPLFTVMLAHWWSGTSQERLTVSHAAGVLVGFLGVAVLIGPAALQLTGGVLGQTLGEVAVLIAAAAYGVGALLSKRFGGSAPLVGPLTMQTSALLMMLPVTLLWDPPTRLPSLAALGSMAELGVFATAVAYLLYFWLIRHVGPTRTALVTYLLPCTALLWGVLFLGERVSWNTLAGLLLVLLGTMVTNGTLSGLIGRRAGRQPAGEMSIAAATETSTATRL